MQHIALPCPGNRQRFLGSAMGIAIANRKNRCDFGALRVFVICRLGGLERRVGKGLGKDWGGGGGGVGKGLAFYASKSRFLRKNED